MTARLAIACLFLLSSPGQIFSQTLKPRTIVTTDGEVDDQDSFIRLLLYSDELNIEGLIYTSSQWHYKGDGKGTKFVSEMPMTKNLYGERTELRWPGTDWMQGFIDKYGQVYDNLLQHDKNYPTPGLLKNRVRVGNIDFEGEMDHNTEGSDLIKTILLDDTPGPVYLQNWGGTNTVARALKSIQDEYKSSDRWQAIYKKVSEKAFLYVILDQDATYKKYIVPNWPDIRVIYNGNQFWSFAYAWPRVVPAALQRELKGKWMAENIKFGHGPLMSSYFLWGDGQKIDGDPEHTQGDTAQAKKYGLDQYDFLSEGDSPSFLNLINTGLRNLEDASYGGWGGRMTRSSTMHNVWEDGKDVSDHDPYTNKPDVAYPQTRWIESLQNDFASRADWCVKTYRDANHAPIVKTNSPDRLARRGAVVRLKGTAFDPDGNSLTFRWWQYQEAGKYVGTITIENPGSLNASFTVPPDAKSGDTIHVILEVEDSGVPALTRYQRVVIRVK